ncbi:MAG: LapA family protein [Calothrix sp. MO_167.B42]|nr:LapA family protein [Calothrix sp. MO_167.B42]
MTASRLILLLAVIVISTILLVQNWSPVLSLVFLGMKTRPLPLAIWIVLSISTGALTSWLIATLHQLPNYLGSQTQPSPSPGSYRAPRVQHTRQEAKFNTANIPKTSKKQDSKTQVIEDDWDTGISEDWGFDESTDNQSTQRDQNQPEKEPRDYERPQKSSKSANSNQSDSVYSYSSREPKNTGVGKTESIYDADYRVIIPPYQPSPKNQQIDDDDWDFLDEDGEEDDFDDDKPSRR